MEFIINPSLLKEELGLLTPVIERKPGVPILSKIKMETNIQGELALTATDLDVMMRVCQVADVLQSGSILVEGRKLYDISRELPNEPIHFQLNKTGEIFYSDFDDEREEFAHEVKVEKLAAEIEEAIAEQIVLQSEQNALDASEMRRIREETAADMLEEVFWEEINQTLEDPFFRSFYDDGEWGEEFQTECGTVDDFIEFLELCVLTEREIRVEGEDYLVVEAETEIEAAGISECSYYTERLGDLVEIACEYYKRADFATTTTTAVTTAVPATRCRQSQLAFRFRKPRALPCARKCWEWFGCAKNSRRWESRRTKSSC